MYSPTTKKNKGGRPTKYNKSICDKIIEYSAKGISLSLIYLKLGISDVTAINWKKTYPEFFSTIKLSKIVRREAWIEVARRNIDNKNFNNVLWMMNMSNMFNWRSSNAQVNADIKKTVKTEIKIPNYNEENNAKLATVAGILQSIGAIGTPAIEVSSDTETN